MKNQRHKCRVGKTMLGSNIPERNWVSWWITIWTWANSVDGNKANATRGCINRNTVKISSHLCSHFCAGWTNSDTLEHIQRTITMIKRHGRKSLWENNWRSCGYLIWRSLWGNVIAVFQNPKDSNVENGIVRKQILIGYQEIFHFALKQWNKLLQEMLDSYGRCLNRVDNHLSEIAIAVDSCTGKGIGLDDLHDSY